MKASHISTCGVFKILTIYNKHDYGGIRIKLVNLPDVRKLFKISISSGPPINLFPSFNIIRLGNLYLDNVSKV